DPHNPTQPNPSPRTSTITRTRMMHPSMPAHIRSATPADVPLILSFIHALADYEKLSHEVEATEEKLRATLFSERPAAECVLAFAPNDTDTAPADSTPSPAGFALFFT